jgi:hypothetical protein
MGWNGMSSRSLAAQSWQKVIAVDTDQLCERLSGYSLGLFIVKDATACKTKSRSRMGEYRLNESCQIPQERAHTHFLNDRSVRPLSMFRILTSLTHWCSVTLCRLAESIQLGRRGRGPYHSTDIGASINGINSMEEIATLLEV